MLTDIFTGQLQELSIADWCDLWCNDQVQARLQAGYTFDYRWCNKANDMVTSLVPPKPLTAQDIQMKKDARALLDIPVSEKIAAGWTFEVKYDRLGNNLVIYLEDLAAKLNKEIVKPVVEKAKL